MSKPQLEYPKVDIHALLHVLNLERAKTEHPPLQIGCSQSALFLPPYTAYVQGFFFVAYVNVSSWNGP
eukprot:15359451-Ditylum_brightwellii.AAC.1